MSYQKRLIEHLYKRTNTSSYQDDKYNVKPKEQTLGLTKSNRREISLGSNISVGETPRQGRANAIDNPHFTIIFEREIKSLRNGFQTRDTVPNESKPHSFHTIHGHSLIRVSRLAHMNTHVELLLQTHFLKYTNN